LTINISETVSGVDAADLLINGVPASSVTSSGPKTYTFSFPQPAYGPVAVADRRERRGGAIQQQVRGIHTGHRFAN